MFVWSAGIPTVRHMRRINVTKASTSDVNNLAVRQNARRPIRHIAYGNATTHHAVHKLS